MTKAVLTWNKNGEIVSEIVYIVPNDAPIYGVGEHAGEKLPITTTDLLNASNKVYFEDNNGIFGVNPEFVVSVEVLPDDDPRAENMPSNENNPLIKESKMDNVKKAAARTKKFVYDHRVAIAVVSTTAVMLKLNKLARKSQEDFMAEHGILDLYYTLSDDE